MKTPLALCGATVAAIVISMPFPACGHHSMAEYDRSAVVELEGEVTRVSWRNPHILIYVTADGGGGQAEWELEGSAVSAQTRRGIFASPVRVGERIRVAGWPSTRRSQHLLVNHVLLPDGAEYLIGGVREPRWSETYVGNERGLIDPAKAASAQGDGIFRVWSQGVRAWFFPGRSDYRLTEAAAAAQAAYDDAEDNPLLDCIPPGMPSLMGNPYPMQFIQQDGHIEVRFEEFDAVRRIHIEDAVDPSTVPASHLGYSVGHWEDDTLVVDTTRINWPYFDRVGAPQSEDVSLRERFTVVDDGDRLDYQLIVTDPENLAEPFVLDIYFLWRPGEEVNPYECTLEH